MYFAFIFKNFIKEEVSKFDYIVFNVCYIYDVTFSDFSDSFCICGWCLSRDPI